MEPSTIHKTPGGPFAGSDIMSSGAKLVIRTYAIGLQRRISLLRNSSEKSSLAVLKTFAKVVTQAVFRLS